MKIINVEFVVHFKCLSNNRCWMVNNIIIVVTDDKHVKSKNNIKRR